MIGSVKFKARVERPDQDEPGNVEGEFNFRQETSRHDVGLAVAGLVVQVFGIGASVLDLVLEHVDKC